MASINDVAKRAGVAKSTVSNVFTGRKLVSEELRERVMKACEELDYVPNFYASSLPLSNRKSHIIAILLEYRPDMTEHTFYGELVISALIRASRKKYSLLVFTNEDQDTLVKYLRSGTAPIDGAILLAPSIEDDRLKQIQNHSIQCVVIGRPGRGVHYDYIDVDNYNLSREVTEMLLKTYDQVYLLNSDNKLTISQDRKDGFIDAYAAQGKNSANPEDFYIDDLVGVAEEGYKIGMEKATRDVAFITCNSSLAVGLYRAIEERGLKVGEDVGVFALGKSSDTTFVPKLSYARQDYNVIGKRAVEMLIDKIESRDTTHCLLIKSKYRLTDSIRKNIDD